MFFVISDFNNLPEFMNPYKMSNIEDSVTVDLSEIKGKPVDAIGHMVFGIDFDHFKSPFCIEKIFGLLEKQTNAVFKFKLVVIEDGARKIKIKLIYVSEEPIDCKIKIKNCTFDIFEHLTIGDELKTFTTTKKDFRLNPTLYFGISVLLIKTTSLKKVFAEKFNDLSTSDFTVKCRDKQFYVHQRILRGKSDYFEAILQNDCIEKRDKMVKIDDFPPKVVEIFLGYFYNDVLPTVSHSIATLFCLLKLADKYNAIELFDAVDSDLSQIFVFALKWPGYDKKFIFLKSLLKKIEEVQVPKITAMIFKWRSTEKDNNSSDDEQWSSLIRRNPNFAMLGGITVGRNDYQSWVRQHISWCLSFDQTIKGRNDFSVLVGSIGEMKGAVKCSPI